MMEDGNIVAVDQLHPNDNVTEVLSELAFSIEQASTHTNAENVEDVSIATPGLFPIHNPLQRFCRFDGHQHPFVDRASQNQRES